MFCVVDPQHRLRDGPLKSDNTFVMILVIEGSSWVLESRSEGFQNA